MHEQRRIIDEKRKRGEPLTWPIPIREAGAQRVRYYFGDEFLIVRSADRRAFFWLVGEGKTSGDPPPSKRR